MDTNRAKEILECAARRLLHTDLGPSSAKPHFPSTAEWPIGERPLMFRLAHYMIQAGAEDDRDITVDCDYNRHIDNQKEFPTKEESLPTLCEKPKRFFPDIVLHERRKNGQNILVCEIKRKDDQRGPERDRERLEKLTKQDGKFRYKLGAFIKIGASAEPPCITIEYFEDGKCKSTKHLAEERHQASAKPA